MSLGRIPRRATALQAAKALGEDVHALWPALRQARPAREQLPMHHTQRLRLQHFREQHEKPYLG